MLAQTCSTSSQFPYIGTVRDRCEKKEFFVVNFCLCFTVYCIRFKKYVRCQKLSHNKLFVGEMKMFIRNAAKSGVCYCSVVCGVHLRTSVCSDEWWIMMWRWQCASLCCSLYKNKWGVRSSAVGDAMQEQIKNRCVYEVMIIKNFLKMMAGVDLSPNDLYVINLYCSEKVRRRQDRWS
jgi:hypothetical protein